MEYAFVEDVSASWESYERFAAALEEPLPDGLILHAAGRTDEGFRIIEIWTSEEAWKRYRADRLEPVLAAFAGAGPPRPKPVFRDLRPEHVVLHHRVAPPARGGGKEKP